MLNTKMLILYYVCLKFEFTSLVKYCHPRKCMQVRALTSMSAKWKKCKNLHNIAMYYWVKFKLATVTEHIYTVIDCNFANHYFIIFYSLLQSDPLSLPPSLFFFFFFFFFISHSLSLHLRSQSTVYPRPLNHRNPPPPNHRSHTTHKNPTTNSIENQSQNQQK